MQNTIATAISGRGKGFSQAVVHFSINPAPENCGIKIVRTDGFPIEVYNSSTVLTSPAWLESNGFDLNTAKPLIAIFRVLGIDNVIVEVDGTELPSMGKSAESYLFLVRSAGKRQQFVEKGTIHLSQPIVVSDKGKWIRLIPSTKFRLACLNSSFQKSFPFYNFGTLVEFSEALFVTEMCRAHSSLEIKKAWNALSVDDLPENTQKIRKQKLIREMNYRELFASLCGLTVLKLDFSFDYVSFNADQAIRDKLILTLLENASTYLSERTEINENQANANDITHSKSLAIGY